MLNLARCLAVVCGVLLSLSSAAQANLITNGDFSAGLAGWISTPQVDSADSAIYVTNAGGLGDTGTGTFAAFGGGQVPGGTLSQSFATTMGQQYVLSFLYGSFGPAGAQQSLNVHVTIGAMNTTITTPGSTTDLGNVFSPYSFTFTADSALTVLTFADVSGTSINVDGLLDNVSVVAAVPETGSTLALLGLALGSMGLVARRVRS